MTPDWPHQPTTRLPDVLIHGGAVFDGRRLLPAGAAMGVVGGRVVALGPLSQVRAEMRELAPRAESVDLAGRLVHPGFTDAHVHALSAGVDRNACDLTEALTAQECLDYVAGYAARAGTEWIVGSGWSMSSFPGGCPTAESLDAVVSDRPAFLLNRDHHGAWVNTRALQLAGIDAATPDPVDGRIERDAGGAPTGTLHEGAMDLVGRLLPPIGTEQALAGLLTAQRYLHSLGITGWQEAIVGDYGGRDCLDPVYRHAEEAGLLTAHVVGASWLPRPTTAGEIGDVVASFAAARDRSAGNRWTLNSVKIMVDGVLENRTALLTDPYESPPNCRCAPERGLGYFDVKILDEVTIACDRAGLDVHFHAIGDAAVHVALDAVRAARLANGLTEGRHHIAHLQLIDPADVGRFATLDVTANLQALWACNDDQLRDLVTPAIGARRNQWHYPFADLVADGARLAMGSDWSVSTPDPWQAISVAVTRTPPGSTDAEPLLPEQRLDLATCLGAYTAGSAWINRRRTGRLVVGAPADLAITDRDPFTLPVAELHGARTDLTVAEGVVVHERSHP